MKKSKGALIDSLDFTPYSLDDIIINSNFLLNLFLTQENDDFSARGTHSALIAFMFGVAITGMLIVIVGLKMKSIRKKLVRRGRRRSLVHEADFLINGMHL